MKFDIDYQDGKPCYVRTDDGFMQTGRPFDEVEDGWMTEQLDLRDYPILKTMIDSGRMVESLVYEVNQLRQENFQLKSELERWKRASGYGN